MDINMKFKEDFEIAALDAETKAKQVISEIRTGSRKLGVVFSKKFENGQATIREMIGTTDGAKDFLKKITYDLYQGRENVPLLYKELYTPIVDRNLPKFIEANEMGPVSVVFLEYFEGGEVKFGTLEAGKRKIVELKTRAAGLEYSEDMVEYNQTWKVSECGVAFGEAFNKLLNHIHLSPIIGATFTTSGSNLVDQKRYQEGTHGYTATAQLIAWDTDLKTTFRNAISVLPLGSIMLANASDLYAIEDAIFGSLYADDKTPSAVRRKLNPENVIYYDGEVFSVGEKEYTYSGVPSGFAFLLYPKKQFKEYIKQDLQVDSNDGDLSRLVVSQLVGRTRRAVVAGLSGKYGAIKIDIAA